MSSFLEIVELVNGDIVLQRAGGEGGALMTIKFSEESKAYLPEGRLEVARAMIHAGIESASQVELVKPENAKSGSTTNLNPNVFVRDSEDLKDLDEWSDSEFALEDLEESRVLH